jgi:HSP20 family protein
MVEVAKRQPTQQTVFTPRADVLETPNELWVYLEMPGVRPEDVEVQFERGELTIQGRVQSEQPANQRWLLREYEPGNYYRAFRVSQDIDPAAISAKLENGVLALRLPRAEAARPRRIAVKSS